MKRLFLLLLTVSLFFACSQKNGDLPQDGNDGTAYLALKFPALLKSASSGNKVNQEQPGTSDESKMGAVTVLLFDADSKCVGTVEFTNPLSNPATESKQVPSKTTKIFVVVNNYATGWNFSTAIGKSWDAINTTAAVTIANIATADAFMMTSAGDNTKGALLNVTVYKTADEAKQKPAVVKVDRLSSKIQVSLGANLGSVNPEFSFIGWKLNTVNRATRLYSERITYADASGTDVPAIYRRDHNYLKAEVDAIADLTTAYTWLTNSTSAATMSPVDNVVADVEYAVENTMDAAAQLWGHTTKVVVKGTYTPTTLTKGESYFSWNSNYYSVAQLKAEYIKAGRETLKTNLVEFLTKAFDAGTTYGDLDADAKKLEVNINAAIDVLDAYSGIKAKYLPVRYYHLSVCYYDALIRHDNEVTTPMALGRYGVVRNNSYTINVTSVKGPGTPWIPDPTDPIDPTDPTDPDDSMDANLSVQVIVNPWTYWVHNVELGE